MYGLKMGRVFVLGVTYFQLIIFVNANSAVTRQYLGVQQHTLNDIEIQDPEHVIETLQGVSKVLCMIFCIEIDTCMSFAFNRELLACLLYDVVYGSTEKGIYKVNTMHYNIGENDKCSVLDGYIHLRHIDGCYHPQPDKYGYYQQATDACSAANGYLVKYNDVAEKTAITNVLKASNGYDLPYWTGAYQDGPGSTWVWRDGTAVSPLSDTFRQGEPSGSGPCAYLDLNLNGLNDFYPCANWPRVLCERDT